MQKTVFRITLAISVVGLTLWLGEIYRKSSHRDKVLAELTILIEEVKNAPKTTQVVDSDGIPIQSEADIKAATDSLKMGCLSKVAASDWKVPLMCEPIVMSLLKDPFDRKDLSFKPKRKLVLAGILLSLAPLYFLILRGLVRRLRNWKTKT